MMLKLQNTIDVLNDWIWGYPLLILLVFVGVYLTIQKIAPIPPIVIAVATPVMLPMPIVAARAVIRA